VSLSDQLKNLHLQGGGGHGVSLSDQLKNLHLQLYYGPRSNEWIGQIGDDYWLLHDKTSSFILCGYSEICIAPNDFDRLRENCLGKLKCIEENPGHDCIVELLPWDGSLSSVRVQIIVPQVDLFFWDWLYGHHQDGWTDVASALQVEGVDNIKLKLYLPEAQGVGHKRLKVFEGEDLVHTDSLVRGEVTEVTIPVRMGRKQSSDIRLETEYAEPVIGTGDQRSLGCLVLDVLSPNT